MLDGFQIDLVLLMRLFGFLIAMDFITGVIANAKLGKLKSRTCADGLFRSMGEVVVLGIFMLFSNAIPHIHDYLEMFMIGFILKELMSICENLYKLDVWLPQSLTKFLSIGVDKVDNGELKTKSKSN